MLIMRSKAACATVAVALAAAIGLSASSASALPAGAMTASFVDNHRADWAVDGTDFYWFADRRVKRRFHPGFDSILYRGSFADGSRTPIARFSGADDYIVEGLSAGGGFAAVTLVNDGLDADFAHGAKSRVVRVSRDGSSKVVLASGVLQSDAESGITIDHGVGRLADCGTLVSAEAVSDTGGVVIGAATSERESTSCGRKANIDNWHYYVLNPDGTTHDILTTPKKVFRHIRVLDGAGYEATTSSGAPALLDVDVLSQRALFTAAQSGRAFVRDLNTGALTGPYGGPLGALDARHTFSITSMDPTGRVALYSVNVARSQDSVNTQFVSGIFQNTGDSGSFVKLTGTPYIQFCGAHLIAQVSRNSGRDVLIEEIDPVSAKEASLTRCDGDYIYGVGTKSKSTVLTAIPLG
jgi:hypothetical protein